MSTKQLFTITTLYTVLLLSFCLSGCQSDKKGHVTSSNIKEKGKTESSLPTTNRAANSFFQAGGFANIMSLRMMPDHRTKAAPLNINADEVWVIVKPKGEPTPSIDDTPGCGAMVVKAPDKEDVPLPLKHTDVQAEVIGYIATAHVTQQFHNPFDTKIEAEYIFPLPQNAAVNDFLMTIGERTIRGIIRERKEAEQIYH